jgi:predicted ferric reductase
MTPMVMSTNQRRIARVDGKLTPDAVMHDAYRGRRPWVYMCGPAPMMQAFSAGFRKRGVPASHIRWEQFDLR